MFENANLHEANLQEAKLERADLITRLGGKLLQFVFEIRLEVFYALLQRRQLVSPKIDRITSYNVCYTKLLRCPF